MVDVETVAQAYGSAASRYIDLVGSVERASQEDRDLIAGWAAELRGPVLDAGSGPGHWSAFLRMLGVEVEGVDLTPEFVAHASATYPEVTFRHGDLRSLDLPDGSLGGVLSWFSLIHTDPEEVPAILRAFARALEPGGGLLVGFFSGEHRRPFDHRVVTAWAWPVAEMVAAIESAGFDAVHAEERAAPNGRINAAVMARRRGRPDPDRR